MLPDLVDQAQLDRANALLAGARGAARILRPTVAGLLVAVIGSAPAIAFDAATFAVAAICLCRIPGPCAVRSVAESASIALPQVSLITQIREGWSYFRSASWLWPVSVAFFVVNLVNTGPWQVLGPTLVGGQGGSSAWV